jgi:hypothetical protein
MGDQGLTAEEQAGWEILGCLWKRQTVKVRQSKQIIPQKYK